MASLRPRLLRALRPGKGRRLRRRLRTRLSAAAPARDVDLGERGAREISRRRGRHAGIRATAPGCQPGQRDDHGRRDFSSREAGIARGLWRDRFATVSPLSTTPARDHVRVGGGGRRLVRAVAHSRRACLATMGCLDPAILSFRRPRRPHQTLVLVRLSSRRRRNVEGPTVFHRSVFFLLATLAAALGARVAPPGRFRFQLRAARFAMAPP